MTDHPKNGRCETWKTDRIGNGYYCGRRTQRFINGRFECATCAKEAKS